MSLFYNPWTQFQNGSSQVYAGAKLYFYETGTTTLQNVYTDSALSVAHANPVVADSSGYFDPIYFDNRLPSYKVVLKDSADTTLQTIDPILSGGDYSVNPVLIASLAALIATAAPSGDAVVYVLGRTSTLDGYQGQFIWNSSDNSTNVTNDTQQAIFVAPSSDTTGASGAWKRDYTGKVNAKWFNATGDGSTDDTTALQAALDWADDLFIPDGDYKIQGVTLSKSKSVEFSEGAMLKPIAPLGSYLFTIDGESETYQGEPGIAVHINKIPIDGESRAHAIGGVRFNFVTRSVIGEINIQGLEGAGMTAHSFRETIIHNFRSRDTGTWTNSTTFDAVVDLSESVTTADGNNNIWINNLNIIYSRGPDIYIDSANTRTSNPRKIHFGDYMIHGHIEASDPVSDPLTAGEKDDRKQIILGTCDEVFFGTGSIQFAATAAYAIHVTTGSNGSAGRIDFGRSYIHSRYDFASTLSNYHGVQLDSGVILMGGVFFGSGYTGFNAVTAASGVDLYINPYNSNVSTGSISITDTNAINVRSMNMNMGNNQITNVSDIIGPAATMEFREGVSGSDTKGFELKYATNTAQPYTIFQGIMEIPTLNPLTANLTSDSIGPALYWDGANLIFWDGTAENVVV